MKEITLGVLLVVCLAAAALDGYALCLPYSVQGQVFYENGTNAEGVEVIVRNMNTSETLADIVGYGNAQASKWYYVNLGNLRGCYAKGNSIEISVGNQKEIIIIDNKGGQTVNAINLSQTTEFVLSLSQGWNLISIPLNLRNKSITYVFSGINFSSIFSYNGSWLYYFNENRNNLIAVNESLGYWINSGKNQALSIKGTEFENVSIALKAGWNLIGYPSLDATLLNETFNVSVISSVNMYNNSKWYSHNPERPERPDWLNTLKYFEPGYGYWVKAK